MAASRPAALRTALAAGGLLAACALLAALLLTGTERLTREPIAEARRAAARAALAVVVPPALHDNDLLADRIEVIAPRWLGVDASLALHRARRAGEPTALAIEAVAPDGYAGAIRLIVGVDAGGRVLGVRVVEHRETPGLGDPIEAGRSDWIRSFEGRSLGDPEPSGWTVRKHGGEFDQFAGATITPRAVVHAVRRVLHYVQLHRDALYAAPIGTRLLHDDRPAGAGGSAAAPAPPPAGGAPARIGPP